MKNLKEFSPEDRFLSLSVYQFPLGNCGGVTDYSKTIYIPCETGHISYEDIQNIGEQAYIFLEEQRSPDYWAAVPNHKEPGMIGPMAGGNLAYCSDSRCKRIYHIHDRFETQECYNTMSR
jgi:hypothetical protein